MKTIIQHERQCLICGSWNIKEHHIFNEELSEKYGLKVWLCPTHKDLTKTRKDLDLEIKQLGQKAFEWKHSREEFVKIFGDNFL